MNFYYLLTCNFLSRSSHATNNNSNKGIAVQKKKSQLMGSKKKKNTLVIAFESDFHRVVCLLCNIIYEEQKN